MPKLRLFRGVDPLESDAIPFPRVHSAAGRFRLRLTDSDDAIRHVEEALESVQNRLDDALFLVNGSWFDDDGPRAA